MTKSKAVFYLLMLGLLLAGSSAAGAPSCRILMNEVRPATLTEDQITSLVKKSNSYQDKRNQDWSERQRCLCCHTTLPFMLARGMDAQSKPLMDKYQQMAAESVNNPSRAPWYHADVQNRNSKPTEAVVNALTLLMYDQASNQPLRDVTLKAVDRIFENMEENGRIHWLDFELQPFESKKGELWGNSMAILAIEMAQKNSNYRAPSAEYNKLKQYLMSQETHLKPNEMSVLLWAESLSSAQPAILNRTQQMHFITEIKRTQNADGSWNQNAVLGQGAAHSDTYSTAIALVGLIKSGHGSSAQAHKAAQWLVEKQITDNVLQMGSGYSLWLSTSMNSPNTLLNNRFASDFATSYASLALQMYRSEVLH